MRFLTFRMNALGGCLSFKLMVWDLIFIKYLFGILEEANYVYVPVQMDICALCCIIC